MKGQARDETEQEVKLVDCAPSGRAYSSFLGLELGL